MMTRKETGLARSWGRDPFALLRQLTGDFEKAFGASPDRLAWSPGVDVFEKDGSLVTKIDLPGMKKEDIKVEVTDGHLAISGERKTEAEEKKEGFYRCEREYGSFYRAVPLPDGANLDDVKASFADGVLEVRVPLPTKAEAKMRKVEIGEPAKPATAV